VKRERQLNFRVPLKQSIMAVSILVKFPEAAAISSSSSSCR